jgi:hypothetical protein
MAGCRRHEERRAPLGSNKRAEQQGAPLAPGSACLTRSVTPFAAAASLSLAKAAPSLARGTRCVPGQGAQAPASLRQPPQASTSRAAGSVTPLAARFACLQPARPRWPDCRSAEHAEPCRARWGAHAIASAGRAYSGWVSHAAIVSARPVTVYAPLRSLCMQKQRQGAPAKVIRVLRLGETSCTRSNTASLQLSSAKWLFHSAKRSGAGTL